MVCLSAVPSVVLAADPPAAAAEEQQEAASPEEQQGGGVTGTEIAADEDKTALGIINKLKDYPLLGEKGANLLQLAEEGLGIKASQIELNKIVPMLVELQKNVHEHYRFDG
ncbi:hypothetical protein, conserved [Eimeria maxima]|uniref:Uncharacterized protein n=1 Tax=Eimeria maxima TaxID=5804 RepID=U6M0B8_EIMMA|nr:hypothetical protein, conserved [Eimeria maxima]CDJ57461.1 hypothetical protein, conserved [Eimeria maxima]